MSFFGVDNEIIGILVVIIAVFFVMNYLKCSIYHIVLFELYVIIELTLMVIFNYIYFAICIIILAIMLYYKIQKGGV